MSGTDKRVAVPAKEGGPRYPTKKPPLCKGRGTTIVVEGLCNNVPLWRFEFTPNPTIYIQSLPDERNSPMREISQSPAIQTSMSVYNTTIYISSLV